MDLKSTAVVAMFVLAIVFIIPNRHIVRQYKIGAVLALLPAMWYGLREFYPHEQYPWAPFLDLAGTIIGLIAIVLLLKGSRISRMQMRNQSESKDIDEDVKD